jgi:23S rRNA pseudouridine1911/1915/1917 synthase
MANERSHAAAHREGLATLPEPRRAVEVPKSLGDVRVDRAVSTLTGISRREAAQLVEAGRVLVDDSVVVDRSRKVRSGERLEVVAAIPGGGAASDPLQYRDTEAVEFTVVHVDDQVIVVDKPAGLVVHHGAGQQGKTLVDGLLERFPDLGALEDASGELGAAFEGPGRPGIVHRLDKGTSGLLVVARTEEARRSLIEQFRTKRAGRKYLALVAGSLVHDRGVIDAPVGRSSREATKMAVTPRGKSARTSYRVIERLDGRPSATLVEATLETGRTHQVRVHMAAIGHPVGGDDRYGERRRAAAIVSGADPQLSPGRLFLHAFELAIDHPTGGRRSWTSDLPRDLVSVLDARRSG